MMIDTAEMRNLPWHVLHRQLAAEAAATGGYASARRQSQPHWRYMPSTGLWMNRKAKGLGESTAPR